MRHRIALQAVRGSEARPLAVCSATVKPAGAAHPDLPRAVLAKAEKRRPRRRAGQLDLLEAADVTGSRALVQSGGRRNVQVPCRAPVQRDDAIIVDSGIVTEMRHEPDGGLEAHEAARTQAGPNS